MKRNKKKSWDFPVGRHEENFRRKRPPTKSQRLEMLEQSRLAAKRANKKKWRNLALMLKEMARTNKEIHDILFA